jgi:hypothetical protein
VSQPWTEQEMDEADALELALLLKDSISKQKEDTRNAMSQRETDGSNSSLAAQDILRQLAAAAAASSIHNDDEFDESDDEFDDDDDEDNDEEDLSVRDLLADDFEKFAKLMDEYFVVENGEWKKHNILHHLQHQSTHEIHLQTIRMRRRMNVNIVIGKKV